MPSRDGPRPAKPAAPHAHAKPVASLVARCVAGDDGAWRELHRAHFPAALSFLRRMGVPRGEAEDMAQEVFIQVFRHLPGFGERAAFNTWLYKICVSQAGRWRRRQRVSGLLRAVLTFGAARRAEAQPHSSSGDAEARRLVVSAVARMKPHLATTFVLYELEGLPGEEIGRVLDVPVATVWTRLHLARREFFRLAEVAPVGERNGK